MASSSSHSQPPKPMYPRSKGKLGWDFENVKARSEKVPDTWWFIPWKHTKDRSKEGSPDPTFEKLLYFKVNEINQEYRGSGMVVEQSDGMVIGCYKIHADTNDGYEDGMALAIAKGDMKPLSGDPSEIIRIAEAVRTQEQKQRLDDLKKELEAGPVAIRRLNGLILDPRPKEIAIHHTQIFDIDDAVSDQEFRKYGDIYPVLEAKIRMAMGDTFNEEKDLPVYRMEEDKAAKKAGLPLPDFGDK